MELGDFVMKVNDCIFWGISGCTAIMGTYIAHAGFRELYLYRSKKKKEMDDKMKFLNSLYAEAMVPEKPTKANSERLLWYVKAELIRH